MLSSSTTRTLAGAARPASTDASDWFGPIAKHSSHCADLDQRELYRTSCARERVAVLATGRFPAGRPVPPEAARPYCVGTHLDPGNQKIKRRDDCRAISRGMRHHRPELAGCNASELGSDH